MNASAPQSEPSPTELTGELETDKTIETSHLEAGSPDQIATEDGPPGDVQVCENQADDGAADHQPSEVDSMQESILQMKRQVQAAPEDPAGTMSCLEKVQDQLIAQLDSLNHRIEDYIELLANQRKSA